MSRTQEFTYSDCDLWFVRFSLDFVCDTLAIGNRLGKVYVWETHTHPPNFLAKLWAPQLKDPIRQTAVSYDGKTILACCEDGSVFRWDASTTG